MAETATAPTLNSYMYGDALAIAISPLSRAKRRSPEFLARGGRHQGLVQENLWDPDAQFFQVLPRGQNAAPAQVREEFGYTPWYFDLRIPTNRRLEPDYGRQWFLCSIWAHHRRTKNSAIRIAYQGHECQWNGPSWPYATSVTLTAHGQFA